jgi:hypothetical protein
MSRRGAAIFPRRRLCRVFPSRLRDLKASIFFFAAPY